MRVGNTEGFSVWGGGGVWFGGVGVEQIDFEEQLVYVFELQKRSRERENY